MTVNEEDSSHLLYVVGKLGINADQDEVTVRYDLTNMIFTGNVTGADFRNEMGGAVAIADADVKQGGGVGDSSVTFTFTGATPKAFGAMATDRAVLALKTVGVALNEFGGIKMSVISENVTHESSYTKGITIAKGFVAKADDFADRTEKCSHFGGERVVLSVHPTRRCPSGEESCYGRLFPSEGQG